MYCEVLTVASAFCRERPTSPSTEEAIQGMLSMAGLLCSPNPVKVASPQEPWWSSHDQSSPLEQREQAQHQRRLQGDNSPMDSQGNSSEAWDNQGLPSPLSRSHVPSPETEYQYCEPSMSPPLHPSKRQTPNPPPISNQATKGLRITLLFAQYQQRNVYLLPVASLGCVQNEVHVRLKVSVFVLNHNQSRSHRQRTVL